MSGFLTGATPEGAGLRPTALHCRIVNYEATGSLQSHHIQPDRGGYMPSNRPNTIEDSGTSLDLGPVLSGHVDRTSQLSPTPCR